MLGIHAFFQVPMIDKFKEPWYKYCLLRHILKYACPTCTCTTTHTAQKHPLGGGVLPVRGVTELSDGQEQAVT